MARYTPAPDHDSFARALAVLEGARFVLDLESAKVLRFMLKPDGCDARLSVDRFVIRFGRHSSTHHYYQHTAPAVVSTLVELSGVSPGARVVRATIGQDTIRAGFEPWSLDRRRVWLDASASEIRIQVRVPRDDDGDLAEPLPEPLDLPPQFIELAAPRPVLTAATHRRATGA